MLNVKQHADDILSDWCRTRAWTTPARNLALCRIRLSDEERTRAAAYVARGVAIGAEEPRLGAVACLLASEALRLRPAGQAWSWDMVRAGASRAFGQATDAILRRFVMRGLPVWGRQIRQAADGDNRYLHSLVLEAGVPQALLERPQFRAFLQEVQKSADGTGCPFKTLARHHQGMLPAAWQQDDTLDIAAELLEALRPYRTILASGPDALERQHPGWRDSLPIDVSEAAARALVMALLQQPVAARQERELDTLCHRVLHRRRDGWRLCIAAERGGKLPAQLTDRPPFTDCEVIRVRFALAGGQIAVAERDGGMAWRFRGLQARPTPMPFDEPATAALLVDGHERHRMRLPGGDALHDLPWVFTPYAEEGVLRFVGYGTTETRESRLFLAVDPSRGSLDLVTGRMEQVGPVENTGRVLMAIEGEARWREPDHALAIRLCTDKEGAGASPIIVTGEAPSWSIPGQLVFLGAPRITAPRGGRLVCRSGGGAWKLLHQPLPDGARSEVALVEDDVILDRCRIVVLPRQARVGSPKVRQGVLEVRLHGLAEAWAALDGFPNAEVRQEGACRVLTVRLSGPEPAEVTLRTGHAGGLELCHTLRIPMPMGGFAEASGRVLADRHLVSSADLPRLRARAGADDPQAQLSIVAHGQNGVSLGRTLAFVEDLSLGRLRSELERLQTTLGDPDAEVRLSVLRNGIEGPRLRLRTFDRMLSFTSGAATLADGIPEEGGLCALDLTRPGAPVVDLRRAEQGQAEGWSLSGLQASGPWLLIGSGNLAGHVRPKCWSPPSCGPLPCRLARAVAIPRFAERQAALADILRHLGANPSGEEAGADWDFLLATLQASVQHAPARFFDALAVAAGMPGVLTRLVFRAMPADLPSLAALESHLPLLWCLVPITAWQDAACEHAEVLRGYGLDPLPLLDTRLADWADLCPGARAAAWATRDAVGIAPPSDLPWTLAQLRAFTVQDAGLRASMAEWAGPDPGEAEWRTAVRQLRNWINVPELVQNGAPHIAAGCAMGRPTSREGVTALRTCHDAAPDRFAERVRFATLLRLAGGQPR